MEICHSLPWHGIRSTRRALFSGWGGSLKRQVKTTGTTRRKNGLLLLLLFVCFLNLEEDMVVSRKRRTMNEWIVIVDVDVWEREKGDDDFITHKYSYFAAQLNKLICHCRRSTFLAMDWLNDFGLVCLPCLTDDTNNKKQDKHKKTQTQTPERLRLL